MRNPFEQAAGPQLSRLLRAASLCLAVLAAPALAASDGGGEARGALSAPPPIDCSAGASRPTIADVESLRQSLEQSGGDRHGRCATQQGLAAALCDSADAARSEGKFREAASAYRECAARYTALALAPQAAEAQLKRGEALIGQIGAAPDAFGTPADTALRFEAADALLAAMSDGSTGVERSKRAVEIAVLLQGLVTPRSADQPRFLIQKYVLDVFREALASEPDRSARNVHRYALARAIASQDPVDAVAGKLAVRLTQDALHGVDRERRPVMRGHLFVLQAKAHEAMERASGVRPRASVRSLARAGRVARGSEDAGVWARFLMARGASQVAIADITFDEPLAARRARQGVRLLRQARRLDPGAAGEDVLTSEASGWAIIASTHPGAASIGAARDALARLEAEVDLPNSPYMVEWMKIRRLEIYAIEASMRREKSDFEYAANTLRQMIEEAGPGSGYDARVALVYALRRSDNPRRARPEMSALLKAAMAERQAAGDPGRAIWLQKFAGRLGLKVSP